MESLDDFTDKTFEDAALYVRTFGTRLDSSKLLFFYGRFKQVKEGKCCVPKPGFFDFQGKQKWEAWRSLDNMSKEQAMAEYVAAVAALDSDWTSKVGTTIAGNKPPLGSGGFGVGVSVMLEPEENRLPDDAKTAFDWCKEGNVEALRRCITSGQACPDDKDDGGLSLMHWAADRGHYEVADYLIASGASVNCTDPDLQTPLHYACACDHVRLVQLLLRHGCDPTCRDIDGQVAATNADNEEIQRLFAQAS